MGEEGKKSKTPRDVVNEPRAGNGGLFEEYRGKRS